MEIYHPLYIMAGYRVGGRKPIRARRNRKAPKPTYVRKVARAEAKKVISRAAEHKHGEAANISSQEINFTGDVSWPLYPVVQGGGDEMYLGTQVQPTWFTFRGKITANGDATNFVRIIVVQWNKGSPSSALSTTDLLQNNANIRAPFSPFDVDTKRRFKVLYDKTYCVINDTGSGRNVASVHFNIPGKKLRKITYTDGSGNVEQGMLRMYAVSDSGVSGHPILDGFGRIYFTDL